MKSDRFILIRHEDRLVLQDSVGEIKPISVDFLQGAMAHRLQYGGGKGQLIAKAVGLSKIKNPTVLDMTAGLGRDGFLLATLGCQVTLLERSPMIYALLEDGLQRAEKEADWVKDLGIQLMHQDAIQANLSKYDVVYLDPMFPERKKSALVKKEMRVLKDVVGDDPDAGQLLPRALQFAKKRVVVKRSKLAPPLTEAEPDSVYSGKSSRFDVYFVR